MINFSIITKSKNWTDTNKYQSIAKKVCNEICNHFKIDSAEFAIVLADNNFIQNLNKQYCAKDKPTNVLSFPADNQFNYDEIQQLGDIIIAYETVLKEATEQDKSFFNHFTHLLLHGLLHLLGLQHTKDNEAEQMEHLERIILKNLKIDDPYAETELIK